MSHPSCAPVALLSHQSPPACTRRALLRGGLGLGLALAAPGVLRPATATAQAMLAVWVAAPRITRTGDCLAHVAVAITLAHVPAGSYLLSGDILEADAGTEETAFCCELHPAQTDLAEGETRRVTLTQHATSVDLGLVKGLGPAAHEASSPDLVELFARVTLRALATDAVLGSWDSPERVAVSRALPGWMPSAHVQGNPLLTPRGPTPPATTRDGRPLPLLPCAQ